MRRTIIVAAAVLALAVALCAVGTAAVNRAVTEADRLRQAAERAARLGDIDTARADMRALYEHWEKQGRTLELITSHDALYEARGGIEDALLCLEQGEKAEFFRASADVGIQLERLRITEAFRWANLY